MRSAFALVTLATVVTMACARPAAQPRPEEPLAVVGTEAICPVIHPRPRAEIESEMTDFRALAGKSDSPSDPVHYFRLVEDCFELACQLAPDSAELRAAESKCFAACRIVSVLPLSTRTVPRGCPARQRASSER